MKCYGENLWQKFYEGRIWGKLNREMEDHLYTCSECLNIYTCIAEKGVENINYKFDEDAANSITEQIKYQKKKEIKNKKNRIILCYAVAASVTVVITATGFFNKIDKNFSHIADKSLRNTQTNQNFAKANGK